FQPLISALILALALNSRSTHFGQGLQFVAFETPLNSLPSVDSGKGSVPSIAAIQRRHPSESPNPPFFRAHRSLAAADLGFARRSSAFGSVSSHAISQYRHRANKGHSSVT